MVKKIRGVAKVADSRVGRYAFIAGVLLAVIVGFYTDMTPTARYGVSLVLVLLGLLVGFLNITTEETVPFLVAAIALMGGNTIIAVAIVPGFLGQMLANMLAYIGIFVAPAALVVALKTIYALAEKR